MGLTRWPTGQAIGPFGTYSAFSTRTASSTGDTTPDVSRSSILFLDNPSTAINVTYFDSQDPLGPEEGQILYVFANNTGTTIQNAGQIYQSKTGGHLLQNEVVQLIHHNSAWFEVSRSRNAQNPIRTEANFTGADESIGDVTGIDMVLIPASDAATTVLGITGGEIGQVITLISTSGGNDVTLSNAGNMRLGLPGTATFVMQTTSAYDFIFDGTNWLSKNSQIN